MSLDLYQDEAVQRLSNMAPVSNPEAGAFDGFVRGTGLATMRGFARTGRAIDFAGAVGPMVQDAITGGTEAQDRYFKEHDDVFNRAVDAWTPKPNEVGAAADVVGGLLSTLPVVLTSPALAVGAAQLGAAEELVQKGVSPAKAGAVGAIEGAGLGLGIWMPILGQNLWQRVAIGGAGFNVAEGVAMRGTAGEILHGTPAAEDYKGFDGKALTLDALMGMAFGTFAHVSPAQRAHGQEVWTRVMSWAENLKPSEVDAILVQRQAQHLNVDSTPGIPESTNAIDAHVGAMRTAIEQLATDKNVDVSDAFIGRTLAAEGEPARIAGFKPDPARADEATAQAKYLVDIADEVRAEEGLPKWTGVPSAETLARMAGAEESMPGRGPSTEGPRGAPETTIFKTAKGSEYVVHEDGTTTRDKAARPEHPGESGPQPRSESTVYVTPDNANKLGEFQAQGGIGTRSLGVDMEQGVIGVRYLSGKDAGKFEGRTVVPFETEPRVGLIPVERWDSGRQAHFGNEIADVSKRTEGPQVPQPGAASSSSQSGAGEPARPSADPLAREAERIATENPDLRIRVGTDADGKPIQRTVREFLDQTRADAVLSREDAKLFAVAAECMLGVM